MGTADRIGRERLAKRARILDAARELFVERGVEAVTLREVAQKIEYSTTAIYVQFKDKQELVEEMVREDFARFGAAIRGTAAIRDPVERLRALGDAYVGFALELPHHYRLLFMTTTGAEHKRRAHPPDEAPPAGLAGYELLVATVEECHRTGRLRPELTDAHAIGQTIWATVHGVVSLLIVMGHAERFDWRPASLLGRLAIEMILSGLLAGGDPARVPGTGTAAKPIAAKPTAAKPTAAKPTAATPTAAKPIAAKPTAAKPIAATPTAAKPTAATPTAAKPTAATPTAAKPIAAKPIAAKPTAAKPAKPAAPRRSRAR